MQKEKQGKAYMKKNIHLEIVRIFALICIIFNHTGENGYLLFQVTDQSVLRMFSIFLSNLCKIGVPLFFMISGALLIPKKESLKELFVKRVLRIIIIIIAFSFIYYVRFYLQHPEYGFNLFFFVKLIYSEPFITPFWFLYSYLTFLLILPFLRRLALALSDKEYLYLGILAVVFLFLIEIPEYVLDCAINISIPLLTTIIIFPMLGYFIENRLRKEFFSHRNYLLAWAAILLNGCAGILMTYLYHSKTGIYDVIFVEKFNLISAAAVFFIIKYNCGRLGQSISDGGTQAPFSKRTERAILYIGSCTFCTYLFEEMLRIDLLIKMFAWLSPPLPKLLVCVFYIACMLAAGIAASTVLRRIPGMKWLGL